MVGSRYGSWGTGPENPSSPNFNKGQSSSSQQKSRDPFENRSWRDLARGFHAYWDNRADPSAASYNTTAEGASGETKKAANAFGTMLRSANLDAIMNNPNIFRWIGLTATLFGGVTIVLPFAWELWKDAYKMEVITTPQETTLPMFTTDWWDQQWKIHHSTWRTYETIMMEDINRYYDSNLKMVEEASGKKLGGVALVPMCGDSRIVSYLSHKFDRVLAFDCSKEAVDLQKLLIERTRGKVDNISVVKGDAFANPENNPYAPSDAFRMPRGKADFIYDRQGITALVPSQQEDYAYLLKRALKDEDGSSIFLEAMYRIQTKTNNNRLRGPPFHLDESGVKKLFPLMDGFRVQCESEDKVITPILEAAEKRRLAGDLPGYTEIRKKNAMIPVRCVVWRDRKAIQEAIGAKGSTYSVSSSSPPPTQRKKWLGLF